MQAKETSSVTTLGPEVARALAAAKANWPAGIDVAYIANQPKTVDDRVTDFFLNLIFGVVVVTVLVALLMGVRNGLLVGFTVVLSIVLTFGIMPLVHVDINQISILALIVALGVIVDAGIVAIDNIERHLRNGRPRTEAAWRGVHELRVPLLTSTLVAMSSFLPFRLMGGAIGDFVRDLAVVTSIALLMSLLVAYFITPILGEWFAVAADGPRGRGPVGRLRGLFDALLAQMQRAYVPLANSAIRRPAVVVGIVLLLLGASVLEIPRLGQQFFPSADRNQFFIDVTAADGTDVRETERIVREVEHAVARQPGVTAYASFVGRGAPRFYYNVLSEQPRPNYAQTIVDTEDPSAAKRIAPVLRDAIAAHIAGARIEVKPLEQGPPVGAPVALRISSEDPAALPNLAATLRSKLRAIPGAVAVRDSLGEPTTKIEVRLNSERSAQTGVSDADVQALLALAYGGAVATQIREADRQTAVVVRLPRAMRTDLSALAGTSVRAAGGAAVPLGEIADIHLAAQTSTTTIRDGLPTWEFRKLRLSLVILSAVPLGLVGAVTGLALTGNHFGFVASLGLASLGGIVTNHTIVLFEYALRERERDPALALERALVLAGTKLLRPIFLTVVASIAGLLPLAFSSQSLWKPFCWVVIFGLAGSMLMTLVAIPAIYRLVSRGKAPEREAHEAHTQATPVRLRETPA